MPQFNKSGIVILLIFVFNAYHVFKNERWATLSVVKHDVSSYYSYLPAAFIYHDLSFSFVVSLPGEIREKISTPVKANHMIVQKMTMGIAILLIPFFYMAHLYSIANGLPATGYTSVYEFSISMAALFYFFIGFLILRKIALRFFDENVVSLLLVISALATNLFYYTTYDSGMSHVYSFCSFSIFLWLTILWHERMSFKLSILVGLVLGMIILIRPTDCVVFVFFILYQVSDVKSFVKKMRLLFSKTNQILVIGVGVFIPVFFQLAYWKFSSGHWIYYSYDGEHFYFNNPHLWEGLFGFRKGFFIYTPVMFFLLPGILCAVKTKKDFGIALLVFFFVNTYVIFSWWCWWYGGSFGSRPMVNSLPLYLLPLGLIVSEVLSKGLWIRVTVLLLITFFCWLNIHQTYQAKLSLLHWDGMNAKTYFAIFGKADYPEDFDIMISTTDADNALRGLPERNLFAASIDKLKLLYSYHVSIRGFNGKFICAEYDTHNDRIIGDRDSNYEWETFLLKRYRGNICTLQSYTGKFFGVNLKDSTIHANKLQCEKTEIFRVKDLGDNLFALKAYDGSYIMLDDKKGFLLKSGSPHAYQKETFRLEPGFTATK